MKKRHFLLLLITLILACKTTTKKEVKEILPSKKKTVYKISNDTLSVAIKSFGAELQSIKYASKEYLWQGNPKFWKHQSPTLFPIVGRLVDHEYNLDGKTYKMKFHGFAWESDFTMVKKTAKSIIFELNSSKKTKAQYPYNFSLQIEYFLRDKNLDVKYYVKNTSKKEDLYFSIGGHPAFNIPLKEDQKRNEYQIVFDTDAMPKSIDKESGLFVDSYTQYFTEPGVLTLQDTTFVRGALVFKPNPFSKATLVHKPTQEKVFTVKFKGFPYLGIWSQKDPKTPFVCVEPWFGVAESVTHNKEFTQKEGIQILKPNKEFYSIYSIEVY